MLADSELLHDMSEFAFNRSGGPLYVYNAKNIFNLYTQTRQNNYIAFNKGTKPCTCIK